MDIGAFETVKLFEFQQHHPDQYLIMAPTSHCRMLTTAPDAKLGDRPVGDSRFPYDDILISWFDRFLLDKAGRLEADAEGAGVPAGRRDVADRRILAAARDRGPDAVPDQRRVCEHAVGRRRTGGRRPGAAGTDSFVADPHNPVPSLGGDLAMDAPVCVDQRTVECRADVLVYSTPVLTEPITIAGDVSAVLYVSADVEDTDVFVKLVDVYPDGTAYNLADSCLRLRYRDGLDKPEKLVPGEIVRVEITGIDDGQLLPGRASAADRGGRLQLPARRPELARLASATTSPTDGPVAHVTLHHGAGHESALVYRAYLGEVTVGTPYAGLTERAAAASRET